ncbi:MAG: glucose-6-phosphate isomerase [Myxococcales bacterium]|nr:glucose-6-phosphate isomerase [Myxococcales bacterium]
MPTPSFAAFRAHLFHDAALGLSVDVSRIAWPADFFAAMEEQAQAAFRHMAALEAGSVANPDEGRQVGHYWLRAPELAPAPAQRAAIESTLAQVRAFAHAVHAGRIRPQRAPKFTDVLVVGIGGSALGPQLATACLGTPADRMRVHFFDNTDPDGIDQVLDGIGDALPRTLVVVVSKSGGTQETRNGMLEVRAAFESAGLSFARHAAAVTGVGSQLDRYAQGEGFLARFPMWDWVGGRTSELSAVGLLPAALQGLDIDGMLAGARAMDAATRVPAARQNPAMLLALAWHAATGGAGRRDMVVLPYRDRLQLFSKYLQQLVMESLGKRHDLQGREVFQGLAVYGNKGSTDQHAYVQQLRDGIDNFFVTFIEVLETRAPERTVVEVEPGVTSGDYLFGFLRGTRRALTDSGRQSITLTLDRLDAASLGMLIALFERAVGLYAHLVGVNAYHQPGVEAGKKAAQAVVALQQIVHATVQAAGRSLGLADIVRAVGAGDDNQETVLAILRHLAAHPDKGVACEPHVSGDLCEARWVARR